MTSPIPSEPRTPRQVYHAAASAGVAIWLTAAAIVSICALQLVAAAFTTSQVAFVVSYSATAIGIIAIAKVRRFRLGETPVPMRVWLAATLVGVTAWYVDYALVTWITPPGDVADLKAFVDEFSIPWAIVSIAMVPAVTEELIFRGLLARSLARHTAAGAILASALAFSLYHVHPVQVVATFPLGLALAVIAVRSDSIVPGMFTHFLNNALVIGLSHNALPDLTSTIDQHPAAALTVAATGMAIGVILPNCKAQNRPHLK